MNNRFLTAIAISVICAGTVALAGLRFNTIQNLLEGPGKESKKTATVTGETTTGEPLVNVTEADGMTAAQLVDWMKKQGYKFVLETTNLPEGTKYEVNLKGAKPDEAIEAIALALDLGWTKKGEVYVLKDELGRHFTWPGEAPELMTPPTEWTEGMKDFGHGMQDWAKNIESWAKQHKLDGKQWKDLSPAERAEFEKSMAELDKALAEMKIQLPKFKDGFMIAPDGSKIKFPEFGPMEGFKVFDGSEMAPLPPLFDKEFMDGMNTLKIKTANIKELISSLTDSQKKLMKDRGYLTPSDLTDKQRKLLDYKAGDKDFNLTFSVDGEKITIKSGSGSSGGAKAPGGTRV